MGHAWFAVGEGLSAVRANPVTMWLPLWLLACADPSASDTDNEPTFEVLTYNVAGLPEGLSRSMPEVYTAQISPKLNDYELVLVQEDFGFHEALASKAQHPYQSEPQPPTDRPLDDGLNRFSALPFDSLQRVTWTSCHGVIDSASDCLASKGFSFAVHTLPDGRALHVYNHHADAGRGVEDASARADNFSQLADFIAAHSSGEAIVVAGDTNLRGFEPDDETVLANFLQQTRLIDSCRSLDCPAEHIDRVLLRSSEELELQPVQWAVAEQFVSHDGEPLSDHDAIAVRVRWR